MTWKNDPEYIKIVCDLLENPEVLKLESITHHNFSNRLVHSLEVSYRSYCLAKRMNLNHIACARAGLLHDFFLENREEIKALGLGRHGKVHPMIAFKNAKKVTYLTDLEIDIILKHMFLNTWSLPKYKESFVVSYVDKVVSINDCMIPVKRKVTRFGVFA